MKTNQFFVIFVILWFEWLANNQQQQNWPWFQQWLFWVLDQVD